MKNIDDKSFLTSNNENTIQKKDSKGISNTIEISFSNKNENNSNFAFQKKLSDNISINNKALSSNQNIIQKKNSNKLNSNQQLNNKNKLDEGNLGSDLENTNYRKKYENEGKKVGGPETGTTSTQTFVTKTTKTTTTIKYESSKPLTSNIQNKYSRTSNTNTSNSKTDIQSKRSNNYNYKVDTSKYTTTNNKTTITSNYSRGNRSNNNDNAFNSQQNQMTPSASSTTTNYTRRYYSKVENTGNNGNNDETKTGYRYNIHKDVAKEDNQGTSQVSKKTVGRGGDFNNVQVTHVIYSKKNKDFQIDEPRVIGNDSFYKKYGGQMGDNTRSMNKNDSAGKYKTAFRSTADLNNTPKTKIPNQNNRVYYNVSDKNDKRKEINNNYRTNDTNKQSYQTTTNYTQNTFSRTDKKQTNTKDIGYDYSKYNRSNYNTNNTNYKTYINNVINNDKNNNNNKNYTSIDYNTPMKNLNINQEISYKYARNNNNAQNNNNVSNNKRGSFTYISNPNNNSNTNSNTNSNRSSKRNIYTNNQSNYNTQNNQNIQNNQNNVTYGFRRANSNQVNNEPKKEVATSNYRYRISNNTTISPKTQNIPASNQTKTNYYEKYNTQYNKKDSKILPSNEIKDNNNQNKYVRYKSSREIKNNNDNYNKYTRNEPSKEIKDNTNVNTSDKKFVRYVSSKEIQNDNNENKYVRNLPSRELKDNKYVRNVPNNNASDKQQMTSKESKENTNEKRYARYFNQRKESNNDNKKEDNFQKDNNEKKTAYQNQISQIKNVIKSNKNNQNDSKNIFLMKNFFKIFINKINKREDEYNKWFRRNCDNNNDVSKKKIYTNYLYYYPVVRKSNKIQLMPYDEWFNRNCEKGENVLKKKKKEQKKIVILNKLQNIINNDKEDIKVINKELKKLNNEDQKDVLHNLRSSINDKLKKEEITNLIDIYDKKQKENEKNKLIQNAKDKETKQQLTNFLNLWDNSLPKKEKEKLFEILNKLFKSNKKKELIEELNKLNIDDKNEAINYLKENNKNKNKDIEEIKNLSEKQKKLNVLANILGGKKNNEESRKEKIKKIADILLNLDAKTKKQCVNYMKNTAEDNAEKNEELNSIMGNLPSENEENFDLEKDEDYSYSSSSSSYDKYLDTASRLNTEENVKELKNGLIGDDVGEFKLLDDDIFDIVNEIQNAEDNPKKLLDEDEFKDVADNLVVNLYENKNNDFAENEEDLNEIVTSLNSMNQKDQIKAVDILKQNADDDKKKQIFSKFRDKVKKVMNAKKFFKEIIDKKNKEDEKLSQLADDFFEELGSIHTIYLDDDNNDEKNKDENKEDENDKEKEKDKDKEDEKINKALNVLDQIEKEDEKEMVIEKIKKGVKNSNQRNKVQKVFNLMKNLNKMKNFAKQVKYRLSLQNSPKIDSTANKDIEYLETGEIKEIVKNFENDLFNERRKPLSRKEERENEEENDKAIKEMAKVIDNMNKKDQEQIINKLKLKADDDYKKSQINRLEKLVKNINNVKSFIEKYKNKDEKVKNIKEIGQTVDKIGVLLFEDIEDDKDNNYEDRMNEALAIINSLDKDQQNRVLTKLESKIDSPENEEKLKKFTKKVNNENKFKSILKNIDIRKSMPKAKEKNSKDEEKGEEKKVEGNVELNDKDLVMVVEAVLKNLFININKDNNEDLYVKEVDKYLIKNEKEKKLRRASLVLNNLRHEDKQRVSGILTYIVDNNDELAKEIKKLNKNIGVMDIENDNGIGNAIIEEYNNDDEAELKDDKLAELTEQLMTDLMKDFSPEENAEKADKLNKGANTIINLNKKDQEKILDTLENLAKDEKQKKIIEKLNKLVEYLNYMRFYLYSVNQNHLNKNKKQNKEINEAQFKNIRNSVISSIFKEEDEENFADFSMINDEQNIDKAALRLSTLNPKHQNKILSEINEKVKKNNDINIIKSVDKLTATLKKLQISNIFSTLFNKKPKKQPKKLGDNEIKEIAENINGVLEKESQPTNFTEKLLVNKHKEEKINQLAQSIYHFDEESKRKTLSYLTQKLRINSQDTINKFRDSLMKKKKADDSINIFASHFYIKSLGRTPLNEDELSLLIENFGKDLFDDSIKDEEIKEDKLNLLANVIKELDDENQQKVLERLEKMPKAKENPALFEDFRYRIVKLNLLKDELNDEKNDMNLLDENQSIMLDLSTFKQPKKGDEIVENNNEGDVDETVTVEITLDDIGQDEIKEICQVFNVDYEIDKKKKEEKEKKEKKEIKKFVNKNIDINKSMNLLASSLVRLDNKTQKKITDSLGENVQNENEKQQLTLLMKRIYDLNSFKKYGKEIKQRKKEQNKNLEDEIKNIEKLNNFSHKNLEKEKLDSLTEGIIEDLYSEPKIDFDKNEEIRKYIFESENEVKIRNSAEKINVLSENDRKSVMEKIKNLADNKEKREKYNKVYQIIDDYQKLKELADKMKNKEKQLHIDENYNFKLSQVLPEDKLETLAEEYAKNLFDSSLGMPQKEELVNKISDELNNLNQNNLEFIMKTIKLKADNEDKQSALNKLSNSVDKLLQSKKFLKRVKEKHTKKLVLEKIINEKKYGIVVLPNEKDDASKNLILMRRPTELNEFKLKGIIDIFIEDLVKLSEEDDNVISSIDKYKKVKENEAKIEEIARVINSLNNSDKVKALEEIKLIFDIPKKVGFYNKFMKTLEKIEREFDKEKREKQKKAIKEIKEEHNEDSSLLYSFVEDKSDLKSDDSDIVNMSDEKDEEKSEENKVDN